MKFENTEWFKEFGHCEWKVTTDDGRVFKSEGWREAWSNQERKDSGSAK